MIKYAFARSFLVRLAGCAVACAFFIGAPLTPGGNRAMAKEDAVRQVNEQVTLTYIDALNLAKKGKYDLAGQLITKILSLLEDSPEARQARQKLEIPPDEATLKAKRSRLQDLKQLFQGAKKALAEKRYSDAEAMLQELKKESPLFKDVQKYLDQIADYKNEQQLKDEQQRQLSAEKERAAQDALIKRSEERARREELARIKDEQRMRELEKKARDKDEEERRQAEIEQRRIEFLIQKKKELLAANEALAWQKSEEEKRVLAAKRKKEQEAAFQQQLVKDERSLKEAQRQADEARRKQLKEELVRWRSEAENQKTEEAKAAQRPAEAAVSTPAPVKPAVKSVSADSGALDPKRKKQIEDQAKIEKIEQLWKDANKLYAGGIYDEAIIYYQEIVKLEGNPRIKYTPEAKKRIENARIKIEEQKKNDLRDDVELTERRMEQEVLKLQVPPYVVPPVKEEASAIQSLVDPPLIRKLLKRKVNMDFDRVDLKTVILFLAQESGANVVASQKVLDLALKVTARFNDTPVEEVIKYISKSQGLFYRIDKDIIWIAHPEEIAKEPVETRIYYLAKGGGLFTEFSPIGSGTTDTGLGGSSAQVTKITTIEDTLKQTIPWPSDASLTYDKRLNALIVRNTPQNLQMLEDILYSMDVTPAQILIEARFLEIDITDTSELGLEMKLNADSAVGEKNGSFAHGFSDSSGVDWTAFTRATEGLNFTYKGVLTSPQFQFVLHALEESKKIKTLSSPRITTLNNQAASIKIVDEWIYPTRYEYEVIQVDLDGDGDFSGSGETTYKNVPKDFLRRDVGILLKVIPAVGADRKTVNLSLIPEVSEATADYFEYTGDVKLPKFTSRNLSTTVVVNSGDTVVLGGLIKESRTKTLTKTPILGDIPFLGNLFKKNTDSVQRKNLLIFVTAKVLSPSGEEVVVVQK